MGALKYERTGRIYWINYDRIPVWDIEIGEDGYETGWRRKRGRCWDSNGKIVEINFFSDLTRTRMVNLKGNHLSPDHLDHFPETISLSFPDIRPSLVNL